jgi:hypothetical protein
MMVLQGRMKGEAQHFAINAACGQKENYQLRTCSTTEFEQYQKTCANTYHAF